MLLFDYFCAENSVAQSMMGNEVCGFLMWLNEWIFVPVEHCITFYKLPH